MSELFAAPEPEVFAVWVDPDGTVFAGTSPHGKVYRIPPGGNGAKGEVYFDPGETYIWALARGADGALLVGHRHPGQALPGGRPRGRARCSTTATTPTCARSMSLPGGDVLLGTAGEGLILRLGKDGQARTLYDAEEPEVVALAPAPDGTCYAAVVSSEASLVDLAKPARRARPAPGRGEAKGSGEASRRAP